jgi:hypothetical protein
MATTDQERKGQIIQYLCSIEAYVVPCCCEFPVLVNNQHNASQVDSPLILALAAAYPTTTWTDPALLSQLLEDGAKRGLFKRNVVGADTFWYINLFLLRSTPANKVYMQYCSAIKDCPFGPKTHPVV